MDLHRAPLGGGGISRKGIGKKASKLQGHDRVNGQEPGCVRVCMYVLPTASCKPLTSPAEQVLPGGAFGDVPIGDQVV